jgi:hypothetical protein
MFNYTPNFEVEMIEKIFEELRDIGIVRSRDQFSAEWLGREKGYLRSLQSKNRRPSTKVLATCAVRLLKNADQLNTADAAIAKAKSAELRRLANSCFAQILDEGLRG